MTLEMVAEVMVGGFLLHVTCAHIYIYTLQRNRDEMSTSV